ncbi:MAG: V-type ATP synthase subunit I [Treponema sp.]|nr:V-type ATP synthase subunit I [Treponema sp.]
MIVPMKKIGLVVQDACKDEALASLRDVGVMHIELSKAPSPRLGEIATRKARIESALALIKPFKMPAPKNDAPQAGRRSVDRHGNAEDEPYSIDAVDAIARPDLVELMLGLGEEREKLDERISALAKERARIAPWGEFDPEGLDILARGGVRARLYELSLEAFRAVPEEIKYLKLSEGKSAVRIMALDDEIPGADPLRVPEKPLSAVTEELRKAREELVALEARIKGFVTRRPVLQKLMDEAQGDFDFERARTELEPVADVPQGMGISYLTGFAPAGEMARLKEAAVKNSWALSASDPTLEDAPPTQLKNNAFTRLVTPLTGFLELLPGYHERDVSGWFLLFVTIFFGMILGDAAYGAIFTLIALLGILKTAKKGVPVALKMLLLFGLGNLAWGTVTASWFAVDHALLPRFLVALSLPQLSTAHGTSEAMVNQNLQLFCFTLALAHLGIARLGGFINGMRKKDPRCLADLGSVGMLIGIYNVVLFLVVSNDERGFPIQTAALYALIIGFALSFLFAYYEKNLLQSILGSLKNIFPVVLGVTGIFSDIMSYIRLWAVGLAGFALASAFNGMAGPMLGSFLIFAGVLILAAGHGLNIALNTLSVLVHGVRLNILEFSGHARLTWSGIPYRPFARASGK